MQEHCKKVYDLIFFGFQRHHHRWQIQADFQLQLPGSTSSWCRDSSRVWWKEERPGECWFEQSQTWNRGTVVYEWVNSAQADMTKG